RLPENLLPDAVLLPDEGGVLPAGLGPGGLLLGVLQEEIAEDPDRAVAVAADLGIVHRPAEQALGGPVAVLEAVNPELHGSHRDPFQPTFALSPIANAIARLQSIGSPAASVTSSQSARSYSGFSPWSDLRSDASRISSRIEILRAKTFFMSMVFIVIFPWRAC